MKIPESMDMLIARCDALSVRVSEMESSKAEILSALGELGIRTNIWMSSSIENRQATDRTFIKIEKELKQLWQRIEEVADDRDGTSALVDVVGMVNELDNALDGQIQVVSSIQQGMKNLNEHWIAKVPADRNIADNRLVHGDRIKPD